MNITIDLETIPSPTRPAPSDIKAPANYKDPEKIAAYQAAGVEDEWRRQALHPLKGRILCIAWAIEDEEPRVIGPGDRDESGLVRAFATALYGAMPVNERTYPLSSVRWIGHNVSEFDLVWLKLRALKYRSTWLAGCINLDRYKGNFEDTMQLMGGYRDKFSLDDACRFFGLGGKTEGLDGSKVCDFWQAGKYETIAAYCKDDVRLARALYRALKN